MRTTPVEPGHRIQLPDDWVAELGLDDMAALEKTDAGILIRPCPVATWDEIHATELPMGTEPALLDLSEVSGDDILF